MNKHQSDSLGMRAKLIRKDPILRSGNWDINITKSKSSVIPVPQHLIGQLQSWGASPPWVVSVSQYLISQLQLWGLVIPKVSVDMWQLTPLLGIRLHYSRLLI
jgi:hypothetical protein